EHLTVEENLLTGAYTRCENAAARKDLDLVYTYFPRLVERRGFKAGYISGGEQQMLAIGRALMARPKLMLLDEPSMGLAPMLVQEIFEIVSRLNREEGVAVLLAEQNATIALKFAQYGYVMETGRIVLDGDARTIADNEDIKEFYLGLTGVGQRKSYRDVKHYRRRQRWLSCAGARRRQRRRPGGAAGRPRPGPATPAGRRGVTFDHANRRWGAPRSTKRIGVRDERVARDPGGVQGVRRGAGGDTRESRRDPG